MDGLGPYIARERIWCGFWLLCALAMLGGFVFAPMPAWFRTIAVVLELLLLLGIAQHYSDEAIRYRALVAWRRDTIERGPVTRV